MSVATLPDTALSFCEHVVEDAMSNATVRIGAWLIGAAAKAGGFPLALTHKQIREGFQTNETFVRGTESRHETILQAIEALEDSGILTVQAGPGMRVKLYTMAP